MDPNDRVALALSAVALAIAIVVASTVTLERVNTRTASNDAPPGTVGLARPHPPLDRAPGEPIQTSGAPSNASHQQRP
ncbi:hypothetical protein SAMN05216338_101798 [Bradyrhizobium sp. Rc2d]|nr:hypothetical protein SAMN05216338_101798 [Bradyrhizobium sp. Rc2d]